MTNVVFIFDMDGVIVDTLEILFEKHMLFLKQNGVEGDRKEFFTKLNGPSLKEIISFLKKKYSLDKDEATLLNEYQLFVQ